MTNGGTERPGAWVAEITDDAATLRRRIGEAHDARRGQRRAAVGRGPRGLRLEDRPSAPEGQAPGVGAETVVSAKLRLLAVNSSSGSGGEFHRVADTGWSESAVTFPAMRLRTSLMTSESSSAGSAWTPAGN